MENVSIPRPLFIALVCALFVCVSAVMYLMGRESMRSNAVAVASPAPTVVPTPPVAAAPSIEPPPPVVPPPSPPPMAVSTPAPRVVVASPVQPRVQVQPQPVATPQAARPRAKSAPPGVSADMRAHVARYFATIDNVVAGDAPSNPQSMANEVLQSAVNGDMTKIDTLIRQGEAAEARLKSMPVPSPCVHHHQQSVVMSADMVTMMRTLRKSIASQDTSGLTALSAHAAQLQSQAEALQTEETQLKRQYGLTGAAGG